MGNTGLEAKKRSLCQNRFDVVKRICTENEIIAEIQNLKNDSTFKSLLEENKVTEYFDCKFKEKKQNALKTVKEKIKRFNGRQKDRIKLAKETYNDTLAEIDECVKEFKTQKPFIANIILTVVSNAITTANTLFNEDLGLSIRTYVRLYDPEATQSKKGINALKTVQKNVNGEKIDVMYKKKEQKGSGKTIYNDTYGPFCKIFVNSHENTIFKHLDDYIMSNINTDRRVLNIVMCGVSGSGKTYTTKQFINKYATNWSEKNEYSYGISIHNVNRMLKSLENKIEQQRPDWLQLFEYIEKECTRCSLSSIKKNDDKIKSTRITPLNTAGSSRCINITEYVSKGRGTLRLFDMPGNEQYFAEPSKSEATSIYGMRNEKKGGPLPYSMRWTAVKLNSGRYPVLHIGEHDYTLKTIVTILIENLAINKIIKDMTTVISDGDPNIIEKYIPEKQRKKSNINKILLMTCIKNVSQLQAPSGYRNTALHKSLEGTKEVLKLSSSVSSIRKNF